MSVKIMGQVWDLDNELIKREEKYVLLAYTDHADHEGGNIYPSIELICEKTGYKERAVQLITRSLEEKGFLVADGKGRNGTNKWRYGRGANFAGVQNNDEGGAKRKVEGVQQDAPKPNVIKPSVVLSEKEIQQVNAKVDAILASGQDQTQLDCLHDFERIFGFGSLPWYSTTAWDKFAKWIIKQAGGAWFDDYVQWRNRDGKYKAFSNKKIRENPAAFMDTGYPEFEASKMYEEPLRML
jgi:hypothetical protein